MSKAVSVAVGRRRLKLTNLDKLMYPEAGLTKADVIEYYRAVAPALMPHLKGRPLTMKRYPDGVEAGFFYQKEAPAHRPEWVSTQAIWSRSNKKDVNFIVVDSVATLVWLANLADLELHVGLSAAASNKRPKAMVFDLDPGPPADVITCCEAALVIRAHLQELGLESFPKTSGSKGLQLYVPLNTTSASYERTKRFAHDLATRLEAEHPKLVVSNMRKELRGGKVLMDWSQNDDMKTTVCVYSLRARPRPTVSTPLRWSEVERASKAGDLTFEHDRVLERVQRDGDLFEGVVKLRQRLPREAG